LNIILIHRAAVMGKSGIATRLPLKSSPRWIPEPVFTIKLNHRKALDRNTGNPLHFHLAGFVSFPDNQTLRHRHLRNIKIIVEKIVIKKLAGWAENDVELYVFRFDGPVQQRSETRIPSANES
jgi:hypothetical protein